MSGRGFLSEEVKATSKRLLGYEISTEELRLMPYIQFTMMNNRRLDVSRINPLEREILSNWRKRKWIDGGASPMSVKKTFWDAMNEILFISYVNYDGDGELEAD